MNLVNTVLFDEITNICDAAHWLRARPGAHTAACCCRTYAVEDTTKFNKMENDLGEMKATRKLNSGVYIHTEKKKKWKGPNYISKICT